MKLGRPPQRDENFIKTHTRKKGVPSSQAQPIIVSHFFLSDSYHIHYVQAKHFLWHVTQCNIL
jgi:hypothetical protein